MPPAKCFIGVGSPHGDDQIGWLIADQVQARLADGSVVYNVGSPLEILDHIDGVEWLGICDACRGNGAEGSWQCWTWPDEQIVKPEFAGSHGISLAAALDLAERLGRLPGTVMIWGIEIAACEPGSPVSSPISAAIPQVADAIIHEIRHCQ